MKIPTKQEALKQLAKTSVGKTLSKKELEFLSQSLKVIAFNKGETIYKQGFNISAYAVLLSGLCKITVENEVSSGGTIISLLKPVNMVGVFSLEDEVFQATASALCDSVVAFIDKQDFATVVTSNGQCAYALFEYLCTFTKKFVRQVVDFGQKPIKSRVASSLLYMTDLVKGDFINMPISRNDLAGYCGIATGSTIRLLSEMAKDKIIVLDKKTIRIKNKEKLIQISKQLDEE